jgi:hypothetical protein
MVDGDEQLSTTASQNMSNRDVVTSLLHDVSTIFQELADRYPDQCVKPLQNFVKTCRGLKTANSFVSALHTFGRYFGVAGVRNRGKISMQPTALQRRIKEIRGKAAGQSGRLKKNIVRHVLGHDYCMPHRSVRAPHDLTACVARNISLGKSHN